MLPCHLVWKEYLLWKIFYKRGEIPSQIPQVKLFHKVLVDSLSMSAPEDPYVTDIIIGN